MATPTERGKAIELPADTAKQYRLTQPLYGGPGFDFPQYNLRGVNMAELTPKMASRLHRSGWKGIELVMQPEAGVRSAELPKVRETKGE
jgi:hypothetical protein